MPELDENGGWVLLVYALAAAALMAALIYTVHRTRARRKVLERLEDKTAKD